MGYGVNVNSNDVSKKLYQWTDLLNGTEEQIISVYKIKEHFF
jgi:hypothetical protein